MRPFSPVIQAVAGVCSAFALAGLAGCGPAPSTTEATNVAAADPAVDYLPPPTLTAVDISPGRVSLTGRSRPRSTVQLAAIPPIGRSLAAPADAAGVFRLEIPAIADARLVSLQMVVGGSNGASRRTPSDGYLFLAPGAPPALLRAGAGTRVLGPPRGRLRITCLDYDAAGGAVLSGTARPGAALSAQLDGVSRGQTRADAEGRFAIQLAPVTVGTHRFTVTGGGGRGDVSITTSNATPLIGSRFRAARTDLGWRIDWMTPGGGLQTSLILN
jgi:hypothetical protein